MSRTLFENSKAALAFAAMTIFGAVAMVGTSEKGGVLDTAVETFANQRETIASDARGFAAAQSKGDAPPEAGSGWGSEPVFGEYGADTAAQAVSGKSARAAASKVGGPMSAPFAATAIVSGEVNQGAVAEPYISDREMVIEPE